MTVLTWLLSPWPWVYVGLPTLLVHLLNRHEAAVDECYDNHPSNWTPE